MRGSGASPVYARFSRAPALAVMCNVGDLERESQLLCTFGHVTGVFHELVVQRIQLIQLLVSKRSDPRSNAWCTRLDDVCI